MTFQPHLRLLIAATVLCFLGGCTNVGMGMINALVPTAGYSRTTDIAYGADPRQQLDIYAPRGPSAARPVVLFFYGGSWRFGARGQYRFLGEALAAKGFVVVVADYRLYPEVKFPVFMEDAAAALRWVTDHAGEYGGDPTQIFAMGHSAGAHMAALLVLDPKYADAANVPRGRIAGLIGLAGPYAFHPERIDSVRGVFVGSGDLDAARPITFVDTAPSLPAIFLAHGGDDDTVNPSNTRDVAEKARARGAIVREIIYPGIGHLGLMAAFARPFRGRAPVLEDVAAFIDGVRRRPAT